MEQLLLDEGWGQDQIWNLVADGEGGVNRDVLVGGSGDDVLTSGVNSQNADHSNLSNQYPKYSHSVHSPNNKLGRSSNIRLTTKSKHGLNIFLISTMNRSENK